MNALILSLTVVQMGETTCPVRQFTGLDSLLGCLATGHYPDCAGHKLGVRFRVKSVVPIVLGYVRLHHDVSAVL